MLKEKLNICFDKEGDSLELRLGKPREMISREIMNDIFIGFHPRTKKPLGLTILNFSKKVAKNKELHLPLVADFQSVSKAQKMASVHL